MCETRAPQYPRGAASARWQNDRVTSASSLDPAIAARLKRDAAGLVAAVVQDAASDEVLMVGWMNDEALHRTLTSGRVTFWSRSRGEYWRKGDTSGHAQYVRGARLDCDGDVVILQVEQLGGIACHTGRESCFYRRFENGEWITVDAVHKHPDEIYAS